MRQLLAEDLREGVYEFRMIPEPAYARAKALSGDWTPTLGTRTADLLHVAAALELKATAFYSFDAQQARAAQAVGLQVAPAPRFKNNKK